MISREDRLEAESRIARLIHSYCHRLDEGDLDAVAAFFKDATWQISPDLVTTGPTEKLAWLRRNTAAHKAYLGPQHLIGNVLIDVADDGQTARGMSYFVVSHLKEGSVQMGARGRYEDSFAIRDNQWRFTHRQVHVDRL